VHDGASLAQVLALRKHESRSVALCVSAGPERRSAGGSELLRRHILLPAWGPSDFPTHILVDRDGSVSTIGVVQDRGYYSGFGGCFIPEVLVQTFEQLVQAFDDARRDPEFWPKYQRLVAEYSGRPTPLTLAENLTRRFKGAQIYVKREDLNHTGAHKANNVLGQGLLVQRMGKRRVIAETGAGQHGVATATMAAKFGFECTIYMGEVDVQRQRPNVFWMQRMGATVVPVKDGTRTLKDSINEAFRDWVTNMDTTHYVLGTACGPHPFPEMVRYFQSIIGQEARAQILERTGRLPRRVYACVGGGSNALGIFNAFLDDPTELVGVEAAGAGIETGRHAARLSSPDASVGVAQGYKTYFLQNEDGQMRETHSVAAGLDYVGVSPILSALHESGRVRFEAVTDVEVVEALALTAKTEGLIPALESSHAFAQAFKEVANLPQTDAVIINQSGRGDKDIFTVADAFDDAEWKEFIREKARGYGA
jgi:tryptophan synthase beta chain